MKAKIILNHPLTQDRYGLHFEKGEAYTENEYLIKKLKSKGVKVEILEEKTEKTIDEMTVAELKKYATEKNIEIPSNVKNKADIIEFIKNYKENKEEGQKEEGQEEQDEKPDNTDTKPDTNSNEADGKEDNNENPKAE